MKILLLEPIYFYQRWPIEIYGTRRFFYVGPLSLLQLAAYFPKISTVIDGMNDLSMTPKKLAKLFLEYNHFDDIIAIGSHSNVGSINTIYTLKLAKLMAPNATIIMGGYHATFFHEKWVKIGADVVIRHEGEISFSNIVNKIMKISLGDKLSDLDLIGTTYSEEWLKKINSIKDIETNSILIENAIGNETSWKYVYKQPLIIQKRKPIFAPDRPFVPNLDQFPIPIREKLDITKNYYPYPTKGLTTVIESSRGCPYNCTFCSTRIMWKKSQRYKSVPILLKEINRCLKLGINRIFFIDEAWGINYKRDMDFINEIKKNNLKFLWGFQIRTNTIKEHPDLIKKAGENGCCLALVGFESIDQSILNNSNKKILMKDFIEVRKILKEAGIFTIGYFMIGLPGETKERRKRLFQSIESLCEIPLIQQYIPYFSDQYTDLKEDSYNLDFYKSKKPLFFVDTKLIGKTKKKGFHTQLSEISKDMRKYLLRLYANPNNLKDILFAKSIVEKTKRTFLLMMYKNLILNILRFRAQDFLNFIRN